MTRSPHTTNVAANLEHLAQELITLSVVRSFPPAKRYLCLRYAPFLRQLGQRKAFCKQLRAIRMTPETSINEARGLVWPLVEGYQFPSAAPYDPLAWAELLVMATTGLVDHVAPPRAGFDDFLGKHIELQFLFHGSLKLFERMADKLPIISVVDLRMPQGLTRTQAKRRLAASIRRPLANFLRRIRPLEKDMLRPSLDVRLILFRSRPHREEPSPDHPGAIRIYLPDPLNEEFIATNFTVRLPSGRRLTQLSGQIAGRLIPALEDTLLYTPAQGRPPDTEDDARWWAMRMLDGMSAEEIAKLESGDHPDAPDLEDTISRTLRRLGLRLRTQ